MGAKTKQVLLLGVFGGIWVGLFAAPRVLAQTALFARGYTVIPEPQQVELKGGDFEFGSGWRLNLGSGVKADDVGVESLKEGLASRDGVTLETAKAGHPPGGAITLTIQPGSVAIGHATDNDRAAIEEQAYKLVLGSEGIGITANAPTGLFYGVETLVQLVKPSAGKLWLPEAAHYRLAGPGAAERLLGRRPPSGADGRAESGAAAGGVLQDQRVFDPAGRTL